MEFILTFQDDGICMKKAVLIHGFAAGLTAAAIYKAEGADGGFWGFKGYISEGKVASFRWSIRTTFNWSQTFNPLSYIQLYFKEKKKAESAELIAVLAEFLQKEQPSKIICHSLGCYLFSNYLAKHRLPNSVTEVVFVQADLPKDVDSVRNHLENLHGSNVKKITNFYCPWDYTLVGGMIINGYVAAGLTGLSANKVENVFYPLYEHPFVHSSSIRSKKFAKKIIESIS